MNLTPEQVKQEREDFEAWLEGLGLEYGSEYSNWFRKTPDGEYEIRHVEHEWAGWLARASLLRSAGDGWMPIETAPKDGTPIIIARIQDGMVYDVCNGSIEVVAEDEEDGPWDIRGGDPWCSYRGRPAGTYFCCWLPDFEREDRWLITPAFEYTHWTATPPPEQGSKG